MIATLFALGPELIIPPILAFRMQPLCCSDRLQGTLQCTGAGVWQYFPSVLKREKSE